MHEYRKTRTRQQITPQKKRYVSAWPDWKPQRQTAGHAARIRPAFDGSKPGDYRGVISAARGGDMQAARLVLERIAPVTRSTAAPVIIPELEAAGSLSEKAQAIVTAVARGECPPNISATMIQAIGACAKTIEIDELERAACPH